MFFYVLLPPTKTTLRFNIIEDFCSKVTFVSSNPHY